MNPQCALWSDVPDGSSRVSNPRPRRIFILQGIASNGVQRMTPDCLLLHLPVKLVSVGRLSRCVCMHCTCLHVCVCPPFSFSLIWRYLRLPTPTGHVPLHHAGRWHSVNAALWAPLFEFSAGGKNSRSVWWFHWSFVADSPAPTYHVQSDVGYLYATLCLASNLLFHQ